MREETDNQRTTVVYEPGSFVPMLRDDTQQGQALSAYITDALGTPMQLVTPNGQPRWLAEPDDWTTVNNQRAVRNVTQPIRFQGQWHDEESGLYYNRHRYYDPQQGRYISQDPIGLNGGTNLYGYVTNPTGMVDPLGLRGGFSRTVPSPNGSPRPPQVDDDSTFWGRVDGDLKCRVYGDCLPDDHIMCTKATYDNDAGEGEIEYLDSYPQWIPLDQEPYPPAPDDMPEGLECTESVVRPYRCTLHRARVK
ncbi:RHS repeat-associated core domain-containing protein [Halovibrio sp. HP20-50]|uniref:RHS repeat-associated core domain-containing protein n=1 Tax=Halovibrio sp. HP20-59 TaxID=3080275 RepID=UPI00294AAD38|nr:RHS repeat-associated core domain-containing protein [Halovibrio sp. HP20-59]MEA2119101.1 RHS repeat-associated core domain-containing protein [Halovibrio sp. HP20-59]